MPVSTFVVSNAELDFLRGIEGEVGGDNTLLDVVLSESRSLHAKDWEPLKASVNCEGSRFRLQLAQPNNAAHLRLDIQHAAPTLEGLQIRTQKLVRPDEAQLRALVKGRSLTFLGCARQCAAAVTESVAKIASLGALFGSYRLIVFENDSTDGTAERVQELAAQLPIELIRHPGLHAALPERTARLAFGRNALLARALELGSDYVCWADLDGVINRELPSEASFLDAFGLHDCWDAVFPVNAGMYYDIWALRHPVLCPHDYTTLGGVMDASLGRPLAVHFAASYVQIDLRGMAGWLPVDSAFGGMGVYKTEALRGTRYIGLREGREICEHVPLNEQLRAQGRRLFINPRFVVASHG
jgi:hypothetical protein